MIAIQAITAYTAVTQLMDQECDFQTAYELLQIKKKLEEPAEFFKNNEHALMLKYADKNEEGAVTVDAEGRFTISGAEEVKKYAEERLNLGKVEINWPHKPVTIKRPEKIKPVMLEALEGIIEFI